MTCEARLDLDVRSILLFPLLKKLARFLYVLLRLTFVFVSVQFCYSSLSLSLSWVNILIHVGGDGMDTHTSKWLSEGREGPMEMIQRVPPSPVKANVVACRGGQSQLGHPVEFIKVLGTTIDEPAVCKYCGLRYYHDAEH